VAGIATATAELYARYNIPSIPLGKNKKPSVRDFKIASLTVDQSRSYMRQRPNANALGVPDGRLSGIVRLDIDEHGEHIEREVIRRAGDTPFKVETASRKRHLIYAYNGERRLTGPAGRSNARPWSDLKVDLCGQGGYSISPPSQCAGGEYRLLGDVTLEQMLENRHRLPTIKGLDARAYVPIAPVAEPAVDDVGDWAPVTGGEDDLSRVSIGDRDAVFYPIVARIAKRVFLNGGTRANAMVEAMGRNSEFQEPLPENQVRLKVEHWWDLTLAGENDFGPGTRGGGWMEAMSDDPPLLAFILWLKGQNRPDSTFLVADGMWIYLNQGDTEGWWSEEKVSAVRRRARDGRWIKKIRKERKGVAAGWVWGSTAKRELFRLS
jgi:hypothetical protein